MNSDLRVIVADDELDKLEAYCRCCPTEIAAMGYVTNNEDGDFYVDEVFLVPQEVTGSSVDFLSKGMVYAVEKAIEEGRINDLRFCWHSHVNMGAFWSGTDEGMIEDIRDSGPVPWFISLVSNKKGEWKARLDLFGPGLSVNGLKHIKNIELEVWRESALDKIEDDEGIIKEMEQFVSVHKPPKDKSKGKTGKAPGSNTSNSKGKTGKAPGSSTSNSTSNGQRTSGGTTDVVPLPAVTPDSMEGSQPVWDLEAKEYSDQQAWARGLWSQANRNHWQHWSDGEGWTYFFDESDGSYKGCCLTDPQIDQPKSQDDLPDPKDGDWSA